MSSDISWNDMIYDLSEGVLSFRLNAISRSLPCPNNLRRWGLRSQGNCQLCSSRCATSAHILSNCYIALTQGRYTWRHDNVLIGIHKHLVGLVAKANRFNKKFLIIPKKKKKLKKTSILLNKARNPNISLNANLVYFIKTILLIGRFLLISGITILYPRKLRWIHFRDPTLLFLRSRRKE